VSPVVASGADCIEAPLEERLTQLHRGKEAIHADDVVAVRLQALEQSQHDFR
jgi:hypothetical protein